MNHVPDQVKVRYFKPLVYKIEGLTQSVGLFYCPSSSLFGILAVKKPGMNKVNQAL
jgi:hypothetical protein